MKTSSSQFDLMVTFMEQHGDLSKPSSDSRCRITAFKNWEELIELLNSDGGGTTNTYEKWKKVWSDLKNNTKKKAARLHRAASGIGGDPAIYAKLTDLERRVLNLMGVQVATGLFVAEAGLPQNIHAEANSSPPLTIAKEEVQSSQPWTVPGPSTQYIAPVLSPPQTRPTTAPLRLFVEVQEEDTGMQSPSMPSSQVHVVRQPELVLPGQTTPHRARPRRRSRGSPRR